MTVVTVAVMAAVGVAVVVVFGGGGVLESKALPSFGLVWAVEIRVIVIVLATSTFFCLNDGFYTM